MGGRARVAQRRQAALRLENNSVLRVAFFVPRFVDAEHEDVNQPEAQVEQDHTDKANRLSAPDAVSQERSRGNHVSSCLAWGVRTGSRDASRAPALRLISEREQEVVVGLAGHYESKHRRGS